MSNPVSSSPYVPLLQNDGDLDTVVESESLMQPFGQCKYDHRRISALYIAIGILVVSNIISLGVIVHLRSIPRSLNPQLIFGKSSQFSRDTLLMGVAPVTDAIEYEVVKFHAGPLNNEEDDIYSSPPSPEVDQAWRDLYEGECSSARRPTLIIYF